METEIENKDKYSFPSKFISINFNDKNVEQISTGHRNPQGLMIIEDKYIISTEHGPRGGDEINHIKTGKNYGWPKNSYGEKYDEVFKNNDPYYYKKNHVKYNFEEPIFAFVPSIGISEIISIDDTFSKRWKNDYLITSLNARSIFRIKFDKKFTRVISVEKIYVGKRIRDISYSLFYKNFFLALEDDTGSLGIISVRNE